MIRLATVSLIAVALLSSSEAGAAECDDAMTQLDMNMCAQRVYEKSDGELNALYKEIMRRLGRSSPEAAQLVAAQKSWISFRDNECSFAASGVMGGSVYPMIFAGCLSRITEARVADLKTYLNCEEGDLACPVPRQ